MTMRIVRFPPPPPLVNPGNHFLKHEKTEVLAEILEPQFQPVTDTSVHLDIETANEALGYNFMAPASEHKLTKPEEVNEAIRGLNFNKVPRPNGISNMAAKHLQ
jgi:hypothetical protein